MRRVAYFGPSCPKKEITMAKFGAILIFSLTLLGLVGCGNNGRKREGNSCRGSERSASDYKPFPQLNETASDYQKIDLSNTDQFVPGVYELKSAEVFYHNKSIKGPLSDLKVHVVQKPNSRKGTDEPFVTSSVCMANFQLGSSFSGGKEIISFMDVRSATDVILTSSYVGFERGDIYKMAPIAFQENQAITPDEFFAGQYDNYDYTFAKTGVDKEKDLAGNNYEWRANLVDGDVSYELRVVYNYYTAEEWAKKQQEKENN